MDASCACVAWLLIKTSKQGNAYGVFLYVWRELAGSQAEQFSPARFWVSLTSLHY